MEGEAVPISEVLTRVLARLALSGNPGVDQVDTEARVAERGRHERQHANDNEKLTVHRSGPQLAVDHREQRRRCGHDLEHLEARVAAGMRRVWQEQRRERRGDDVVAVHAAAACARRAMSASERATPFALAISIRAGRRQFGMRPLVFQLDTVDGVRPMADATALVPPSRSMMSLTVCMARNYDIRNFWASH